LHVSVGGGSLLKEDVIRFGRIQIAHKTRCFGMKPLSVDIRAGLHNRTSE